jgi:DUF4097 and DUF4098 domain-containing protein YvlB
VVGPVHLETEHGEVTGEGLDARSVRGTSEHGDVRLSMSGVPRDLVAETEHGDVEVTVPDLVTYRVDADTEHGTTQTHVRIDPRSPRSIAARSEHGDVVVRNGGVVVVPPAPPAP